jgi:hypothetical protein
MKQLFQLHRDEAAIDNILLLAASKDSIQALI